MIIQRLLQSLGKVAVFAIALAVSAFYLLAFFEGAEVWFGWKGWWVPVLGVIIMFASGPIGTIVIAVIGGYGAYYGWGWHWLLCAIVFFPGFAAVIGSALFKLAAGMFTRRPDAP